MADGKKRRRSTAAERENAVAAVVAGGDVIKVAAELGVSPSTVKGWVKKAQSVAVVTASKDRREMVKTLEEVAWKLLDVMPKKLSNAPLNQIASALGQTLDRLRLLREESQDAEQLPLDLSRMTHEDLAKLDRLLTDLIGAFPYPPVGAGRDAQKASPGPVADALESPLPAAPPDGTTG